MKSLPQKQSGFLSRCLFALAMCILFTAAAQTQPLISRVKDIAKLDGIQDNALMGYGLVAGLNGTGDGRRGFTAQTLTNLMQGLGVNVLQPDSISTEVIPDNVAAVMVTCYLPPFARPGSKVDVTVSSIGRASSLQGGYLLLTPLKGADGKYHGVAQGGISIGGVKASGGGGGGGAGSASVQENHPTVGIIANGLIIEGEPIQHEVIQDGNALRWLLDNPDFKTASNLQRKINTVCGQKVAIAEDAAAVRVFLAMTREGEILLGNQAFDSLVDAIAYIDETQIETDEPAKIIINERTGTIIGGEDIRVRNVVIAYGTLRITIQTTPEVTPGQPFSDAGNTTTTQANVQVQTGDKVAVIRGTTLGEVITNLNTLGFTPKDLINILQLMHAYGAIKADLIFQ